MATHSKYAPPSFGAAFLVAVLRLLAFFQIICGIVSAVAIWPGAGKTPTSIYPVISPGCMIFRC